MDALQMGASAPHSTTFATVSAGTTSTVTIGTDVNFTIGGYAYLKAATSNIVTPTTDLPNGNAFRAIVLNQGTVILLGLTAAGGLVAAQGDVEALDDQGDFIIAPQIARMGDTAAPFGLIILKGGSTLVSTWTFGTDNLSAVTGMTYTFSDLMYVPDRPVVA